MVDVAKEQHRLGFGRAVKSDPSLAAGGQAFNGVFTYLMICMRKRPTQSSGPSGGGRENPLFTLAAGSHNLARRTGSEAGRDLPDTATGLFPDGIPCSWLEWWAW